MELVVSLLAGYSSRTSCTFGGGDVVRSFSVGSQADWLVRAKGVEGVHLLLAFDGKELFAACASHSGLVYVGGAAIDQKWHKVPDGAELSFGEARLGVSSRATDAVRDAQAPVRLPSYFVDMVGKSAARAPARASEPLARAPRERANHVRLVVGVLAACVLLLLAAGLVKLWQARAAALAAAPPSASVSPLAPEALPEAEPSASVARAASPPSPPALAVPIEPRVAPEPTLAVPAEPKRIVSYPQNVANRPIPRVGSEPWLISSEWRQHHERLLGAPNRSAAQVVFLGDSITEAWRFAPAYKERFERYSPLNLGVAGDLTQHLLWRLANGEIDGIHPKVAVLMIGINNLAGGFSAEDTVGGVRAVVGTVRQRLPDTLILLLTILPARHDADDPLRAKIADANHLLVGLATPGRVLVHDLGAPLLEADGTISKEIMRDFLHPSAAGYERLSAGLAPLLEQALGGATPVQ